MTISVGEAASDSPAAGRLEIKLKCNTQGLMGTGQLAAIRAAAQVSLRE